MSIEKQIRKLNYEFVKDKFSKDNIQEWDPILIEESCELSTILARNRVEGHQWDKFVIFFQDLKNELYDYNFDIIDRYQKEYERALEFKLSLINQPEYEEYRDYIPDDLIEDRKLVIQANWLLYSFVVNE